MARPKGIKPSITADQFHVGQAMSELREHLELTQKVLADRMGCAGSDLGKWEREKIFPSMQNVIKWCQATGITTSELFAYAELLNEAELEPKTEQCQPSSPSTSPS